MPQVVQALRTKYGVEPKVHDPDEAVAKGAAILGANSVLRQMLEEKVKEMTGDDDFSLDVEGSENNLALEAAQRELRDDGYSLEAIESAMTQVVNVSSKTFGTLSVPWVWADQGRYDNRLFNLIYHNTPLPTKTTYNCGTLQDNQDSVHFAVLENEEDAPLSEKDRETVAKLGVDPEVGTPLWEDDLTIPSGLPKDEPLEVIFEMDKEGLLEVTCRHVATGRSIHTVIRTSATMSKTEEREAQQRMAELVVE